MMAAPTALSEVRTRAPGREHDRHDLQAARENAAAIAREMARLDVEMDAGEARVTQLEEELTAVRERATALAQSIKDTERGLAALRGAREQLRADSRLAARQVAEAERRHDRAGANVLTRAGGFLGSLLRPS